MNFNDYFIALNELDESLYKVTSLSEGIIRLQTQIHELQNKQPPTTESSSTHKPAFLENLINKKRSLERELINQQERAHTLETALKSESFKALGPAGETLIQEAIVNIKITRRLLPSPQTQMNSNESLLPTDLIKAKPDANNHGFNLKAYQQILPLAKLAFAIEKNGVPEEHAYKLAVLFGHTEPDVLKHVNEYLRACSKSAPKNLQFFPDACLFNLPTGSRWTVEAWRTWVRGDMQNFVKGERGIVLALSEAGQIEAQILALRENQEKQKWLSNQEKERAKRNKKSEKSEKTIKNVEKIDNSQYVDTLWQTEWKKITPKIFSEVPLKEILSSHASLSYTRGNENPNAANKFRKYGLSEVDFDNYLALTPKDSDKIPNIIFDGAEISPDLSGYYLKKMDPKDPTCAVLGKKTGCCQSMGGAGETCTIHGITSENGGFYVLCAGDPKNPKDTDDIKAQCWAWRSSAGALVFDSLEIQNNIRQATIGNLSGEEAVSLMYALLGIKLVENPKYGISTVNVGQGGNTPPLIRIFPATIEHLADYEGYRDSIAQSMICETKNAQIMKNFYLLLIALKNNESDINHLLKDLQPDDFLYILSQIIVYDLKAKLLTTQTVQNLISHYNNTTSYKIDENLQKKQLTVVKLASEVNRLQCASTLLSLYELGLDINKHIIGIDGMTVMEIFLEARDWQAARKILDFGMDTTKGNVMVWATGKPYTNKDDEKIGEEQIRLIRDLVKKGASVNQEFDGMFGLVTPIGQLVRTGNIDKLDEFISWGVDRTLGQTVAHAVDVKNFQAVKQLIQYGFPAEKGDLLEYYIHPVDNDYNLIDEMINLGCKKETSRALTMSLGAYPRELAGKLLSRDVGTDPETIIKYNTLEVLVQFKRFDVLPSLIDHIRKPNKVFYIDEGYTDGYAKTVIAKTLLSALIEAQEFKLAKTLVDKGASLAILKTKNPSVDDDFKVLLLNDETNMVLAECLKHHTPEAYQFALELMAKGASMKGVDLQEQREGKKVGNLLLALAVNQDNKEAIALLNKEGFKNESTVRQKFLQFSLGATLPATHETSTEKNDDPNIKPKSSPK